MSLLVRIGTWQGKLDFLISSLLKKSASRRRPLVGLFGLSRLFG
jgi:hypothetical protein